MNICKNVVKGCGEIVKYSLGLAAPLLNGDTLPEV